MKLGDAHLVDAVAALRRHVRNGRVERHLCQRKQQRLWEEEIYNVVGQPGDCAGEPADPESQGISAAVIPTGLMQGDPPKTPGSRNHKPRQSSFVVETIFVLAPIDFRLLNPVVRAFEQSTLQIIFLTPLDLVFVWLDPEGPEINVYPPVRAILRVERRILVPEIGGIRRRIRLEALPAVISMMRLSSIFARTSPSGAK
jgi:hypothetical protein